MRTLPTIGRALRSKLWLILLLTLSAGLAAYGASLVRPPVYEASTLLSIDESQSASQGFDVAMQTDQFLAQRFISLGTSREVLQDVCAKEHRGCTPAALARQVRVTTPRATAQLLIVADASSPSTAARLANETAAVLIAHNRAQVDQQMGAELAYLQNQLQTLNGQVAQAVQQASADDKAGKSNATSVSQLGFLQAQYSSIYQRLQDFEVQRSQRADVLSVEQRAGPPQTPVDPDPVRYVLVGLACGLVTGVLLALLAEGMRTRVKRSSDVAEAAGTDVVLDFSRDVLHGAGRPYAYLAHITLAEPTEQPAGLLLVGSTLGEHVNDVGRELAESVAASGRRVLVRLAPTAKRGGWRRRREARQAAPLVVEPSGSTGRATSASEDQVQLVVQCSLPPTLDPSGNWLRATPDRAILLVTKGRTRLGEVRQTVEMLDRAGVRVVAAILLPTRMTPASLAPAERPRPQPASPVSTALER